MIKSRSILIAAIAVLLILTVYFTVHKFYKRSAPAQEQSKTVSEQKPKFKLPSGSETYRISQSGTVMPKIVQATIDPPDVHVGNIQKLTVVVQDATSISFVEAQIETDHGTKTLMLGLVGPVADAELVPERYVVDSSNHLVSNDHQSTWASASLGSVAHAAGAPNLKYETSWTVEDTHNTKYHTKFIVTDTAGKTNSITLAWSDACGIPTGGNWSLSSNGNCTISATDGVDGGNATIDTYTLTLNSTFAYNPGQSISVTTGAIAIGSGGQLQKTYLWVADLDGDGYPNSAQQAQDTIPGFQWHHRYLGNFADDCNDGNANVYQNVNTGTDVDQDGYIIESGKSANCVGASTVINGLTYYKNTSGSYSWLGTQLGYNDCDDTNANTFQSILGGLDADHDFYIVGSSATTICAGNWTTFNGFHYYYVPTTVNYNSGYKWLESVNIWGYNDANDSNPGIH
jgi:hypothetical protein